MSPRETHSPKPQHCQGQSRSKPLLRAMSHVSLKRVNVGWTLLSLP